MSTKIELHEALEAFEESVRKLTNFDMPEGEVLFVEMCETAHRLVELSKEQSILLNWLIVNTDLREFLEICEGFYKEHTSFAEFKFAYVV